MFIVQLEVTLRERVEGVLSAGHVAPLLDSVMPAKAGTHDTLRRGCVLSSVSHADTGVDGRLRGHDVVCVVYDAMKCLRTSNESLAS